MTRLRLLRLLSLLWFLPCTFAWAQLTPPLRARLIEQVELAVGDLQVSRLPDFEGAKQEVLRRIDALEPYFSRTTEPGNRDAWLRYLHLDPLQDALLSEIVASDLLSEATAVRDRLIGTTPGLELSAVRQLRDAIDQLINATLFRNQDQSISMLGAQLQALAESVREANDLPSPDQFNAISTRVALIESSGQAEGVVRDFREAFDRPNLAILVGSSLVQQAINRPVERQRVVNDCILGTRLIGDALMRGKVEATLLPSDGSARIQLAFAGEVVSHNTGYNGPVRLQTVGNGQVTAIQTMTVNASGIGFAETWSQADLQTQVLRIDHKLAIVRAIARKQAAKQKPAADRIALQKLRTQVATQFGSETAGVSPVTPSELLDQAEPMLQRLSLTRPTQGWSSSSDAIYVDSVFRGPQQLSAVVARPNVSSPFEIAVQIHESAVENAFSTILAGRSLNERRLNELLEKVRRQESEESASDKEDESDPPFEISFSRSRPVIFEAREGRLRLGLRGTRFAQGDRTPLVKAMEITADYEPVFVGDGEVVLRRIGPVNVDFPRDRLTVREVGLKSIILRKFSEIFPEAILDQSIPVGDDAKLESLRGREFRSSMVESSDGWLTVAFQ